MLSFGFPPISSPSARVLVLGSPPGRLSLERGEYYANPLEPRPVCRPCQTSRLRLLYDGASVSAHVDTNSSAAAAMAEMVLDQAIQ
jgi:hypothetical protein